jgi:hypothetical protein
MAWLDGFLENRGWLGIVQYSTTTGALQSGGENSTGTSSVTIAQFLVLDPTDYIGATLLVEDIPAAHSSYNGVEVAANAAGTGWIWKQTPSFTRTTVPTAAVAEGWIIFVSDVGVRGSYWYSNGTRYTLAQDSVVLSSISADIALTGMPTTPTVANQITIPLMDGQSIWGTGDILEINQVAEKTGAADILTHYIYIGANSRVLNDAETNTQLVSMGSGVNTAIEVGCLHRIRRNSGTAAKLLAGTGSLHLATAATAKTATTTITDTTLYIDAALKVTASTTDTALTLTAHTVRLISAGAA